MNLPHLTFACAFTVDILPSDRTIGPGNKVTLVWVDYSTGNSMHCHWAEAQMLLERG
jgi:hypothetical protein